MKIKRVKLSGSNEISLAVLIEDNWIIIKAILEYIEDIETRRLIEENSEDLIKFLQHRNEIEEKLLTSVKDISDRKIDLSREHTDIIPFNPLQYRDFMLSEEHVINSSRSFVKMMMPKLWPVVWGYEKITRKVFPKLKPSKTWYECPIYYKGSVMSFITDNDEVEFPEYATIRDYELELGMIITKEIKNATEDEALAAIGGFCIFNDFSTRNVQLAEMTDTGFGPCKAKDFANAISTVVVTPDEILPIIDKLTAKVVINGKIAAENKLGGFHHSIGSAVAYASKGEKVYPGEFMGTGTIPKCCGMENSHLLNPGDEIVVEIENIGKLKNFIKQ